MADVAAQKLACAYGPEDIFIASAAAFAASRAPSDASMSDPGAIFSPDAYLSAYSGPQMVDHSGHVHLLRLFPFSAPPNLASIDLSRGLIIKRLMGTLLIVELKVGHQA